MIQHSALLEPGPKGLLDLGKVSPPDMRYENTLIIATEDYPNLTRGWRNHDGLNRHETRPRPLRII
jgi:hypothetical protein